MIKKLLTVFTCVFVFSAGAVFAQLQNKIYDPLESLNKNVPPNIMITVDNSGSMKADELGRLIYGYYGNLQNTYPTTSSPDPGAEYSLYYYGCVGDFWHFNLEDTSFYNSDDYNIARDDGSWDKEVSYVDPTYSLPASYSFSSTSTDDVDFVGIGVNIWVKKGYRSSLSNITSISVSHSFTNKLGNTETITNAVPINQDPANPSAYTFEDYFYYTGWEKTYGGSTWRQYRLKYAFKDFYQYTYTIGVDTMTGHVPAAGSWRVGISGGDSNLKLGQIGFTFKPYISRIAIMKTVLQRLFDEIDYARLALGTYEHDWVWNDTGRTMQDAQGMTINESRGAYFWRVNSSDYGFSLLEDWPSNDLGIMDNRAALKDWVGMNEFKSNSRFFNSSTQINELNASGGTPINEALEGVRAKINSEVNSDPYADCRNYVSILLTDGECTSGDCSDIPTTIENTYYDHTVGSRGTRTYVIGFTMTDSTDLDTWADIGYDGMTTGDVGNETQKAFTPSNSKELMTALKKAIYDGTDKEVVLDSDVVFGTVDPQKARDYNDLFNDRTVYIVYENDTSTEEVAKNEDELEEDDVIIKTISSYYPSVVSNILYSTRAYYSSWNGSLMAYQPIYKVVTASDTDNVTELKYFDNGNYPVVWDAKVELDKRLMGEGEGPSHVNGIRDALGQTIFLPTPDDDPVFRDIFLIDSSKTSYINIGEYSWNETRGRWVSDHISTVAGLLGESEVYAEAFIDFLQTRQLADITNSTPSFCGEPEMGFDEWNDDYFYYKINMRKNRIPIVLVGANDGMLHAFNAYDGEEIWTVVPNGVIPKIKRMVNNYEPLDNPSGQIPLTDLDYLGRSGHIYGVASSPKVVDVFTSSTDGDGVTQEDWGTYMVCGLGGGGNSYFALDITDTYNPVPKWEVDYAGFGETWTHPAMWRGVTQGQNQNDTFFANVGFFTSGYSSDPNKGKTLYVLDILTGAELSSAGNKLKDPGFFISAPAGILNTELSEIQGVYFGDSEGNMYRYDLKDQDLCLTYQTSGETPIMANPSVHKSVDRVEWVSFGELGQEDRANSLFAKGSTLYTYKVPTCSANKSLVNLTSEISSSSMFNESYPLGGKDGFYFTLQDNEILLTDPLNTTFYYEVTDGAESHWEYQTVSIFVTYKYPDLATDACGDGHSYMYIFGISDLFVGDSEGDGEMASEIGAGRSGNPVKTGVTNSVWINSKTGPVRILPLDSDVAAQSIELFFYFSGKDSRKIGAGSWYVR